MIPISITAELAYLFEHSLEFEGLTSRDDTSRHFMKPSIVKQVQNHYYWKCNFIQRESDRIARFSPYDYDNYHWHRWNHRDLPFAKPYR